MDDALKRLDKLTYEQAQMAAAEVQRATQVLDERVGEVMEQASAVDVREVSVTDEVAEVINGVHPITFISTLLNPCSPFR